MSKWNSFRVSGVLLVAGLALAACGGSSSTATSSTTSTTSATTTTVNPALATTQITTNWQDFFNGLSNNNAAKLALLQNHQTLTGTFNTNERKNAKTAAATGAKVSSVTILSPSECQAAAVKVSVCAKVTYDLVNNVTQAPLLANQTGYAVDVNGQWLVSENTFCALMSLAGATCPS